MNEEAGANHGEDDQPQRQFQNGRLVAEQALLGNAPAIQEQQWRQEQQEEQLRFQLVPCIENAGDHRAQGDLDQRQRQRKRQDADEVTAGRDRQQHGEDDIDRMHENPE